jgi:hypothetical protein
VGGRLARAFWGWQTGAARRRAKRAALQDALLHWRRAALVAALAAWRRGAGLQAHERRGTAGADAWRRGRVLAVAVAAWRLRARRKAEGRQRAEWAMGRQRQNRLGHTFDQWRKVRQSGSLPLFAWDQRTCLSLLCPLGVLANHISPRATLFHASVSVGKSGFPPPLILG